MAKSALRRAIIKTNGNTLPRDAAVVVDLIKQEIGSSTEKIENIIIECFESFKRQDSKSRDEIYIKGIRKINSLTARMNNTISADPAIKASRSTCTSCEVNASIFLR